jgi:hypothetical protein
MNGNAGGDFNNLTAQKALTLDRLRAKDSLILIKIHRRIKMSKRMISLIVLAAVVMIAFVACDNKAEEQTTVAPQTQQVQPNPEIEALKSKLAETEKAITAIELRIQDMEEDFAENVGKIKSEVGKFKDAQNALAAKVAQPGATAALQTGPKPVAQPAVPAKQPKGMSPTTRLILIVLILAGAVAIFVIVLRPKAVSEEDFDDFDDDFEDFEIDDDGVTDEGEEEKKE